ncbi:TIM barrel protein [Fulvimarina sp. MAC3]|uniref:bifunctional sugar phosphate isomerase/epimerase/4-hydroxyphenylpyruvate dioxygenase family protein n=1 Tax=Fulvimarina sp. MAC3 TaxID=3148887 RepID=UPI0031FD4BDF
MKTSIATVSISGDLAEKLSAIAMAGFTGVEIFENDFLAFDGGPREVGRMVRDHGLDILLYQPFRDFEGMPEPQRSRGFERATHKFDLMEALGTDLMLICSNVSPIALGGVDRAAADLRELGELAESRGLKIGYEALAWGRHVNDHRDAWEIVRRADHPAVGLILDSFHTLARGIDPQTIRSIPADKIAFVQLADAPKIDMDLLYWSRHFRNMPGQGDLDVAAFMRAVASTGYEGTVSLEIFNDQFRAASPRSIALDGYRSLVNLLDRVRREETATTLAALPAIPPQISASHIEFVEFAANETEAEELDAFFTGMGFCEVGRHISKDVALYRQGGIHLLVNTEREGFAHSAYIVHGTSVCDVGLMVEDAEATLQRAKALKVDVFEQPVGPGELTIPAVRGVGGGLIHFLDQGSSLKDVWDIEFRGDEANTGEENQGVGLLAIDHIAQSMNYEEMLTWTLFYTSLFKTQRKPMVDIVDPGGLVRSQAIEGDGGTLRVTLNGAENRRTLAGHFIAESFGSSVQHLAFRTEDIFETVAKLAEKDFRPLSISDNYYDDLQARFGLDPALTDRLREANILYDRDEIGGEYFQLYSQTYGEGFFFEIVERRSGYDGYGAANAPFRIAAQMRSLRPKGMPKR